MKKVEAVIQGFKIDEVREALAKEKIPRITVFEVKGAGSHQGKLKAYRGAQYIEDSAEVKIEIVAADEDAKRIAELIINALRTGGLGDGEVIIVPIQENFGLRVGQQGHRPTHWDRVPATSPMHNTTGLESYLKAVVKNLTKQIEAIIKPLALRRH